MLCDCGASDKLVVKPLHIKPGLHRGPCFEGGEGLPSC